MCHLGTQSLWCVTKVRERVLVWREPAVIVQQVGVARSVRVRKIITTCSLVLRRFGALSAVTTKSQVNPTGFGRGRTRGRFTVAHLCGCDKGVVMLSHSRKAVAGLRAPGARLLASKAALVKSLAADQKALADAVVALGPNASYVKVKELSESDPFAATMAKVKAEDLSWTWSMIESSPSKPPVTVCVSGAGTPVGAAALYRIAAGEMLGPDQPVTLNVLGADAAVVKDIEACGFPLLKSIAAAPNGTAAMTGAKYALLLGGDMAELGKAAPKGALVGALGCTNAHAASKAAGAGGASITAITRAPQLAAEVQLASAAGVSPTAVSNVRSSLSPPAHPPPPALLA